MEDTNVKLFNAAMHRTTKPKFKYQHKFNLFVPIEGFSKPAKLEIECAVEVYTDKNNAVVAITKFEGIEKCDKQLLLKIFALPWRTNKFTPENIVYILRTEGKETIDILVPTYIKNTVLISHVEWMFFDKIIDIKKA